MAADAASSFVRAQWPYSWTCAGMRQIAAECADCADLRWKDAYDDGAPLISKNRTLVLNSEDKALN